MNDRFTLFDLDTYRKRLARARTAMARHGLGCLCFRCSGKSLLSGWLRQLDPAVNSPQAMIFTRGTTNQPCC